MGLGSTATTTAGVLAVVGAVVVLAGPRAVEPAASPLAGTAGPPPAELLAAGAATERVEYSWPSGGPVEVLRPFVRPAERWSPGHRGADLALGPGADVLAAADGVVAFAGTVAGRGVVSVDHADGVRTTYEPVAAVVVRGERVIAGQVVGRLDGAGHCAPVSCLHWGARRGQDDYLDPLGLLAEEVVIRLLPRHGG